MSVTHVYGSPKPAKKSAKLIPSGAPSSKADTARDIFKQMQSEPRKAVLERFQIEAGLTKAGAATYYQNFRKELGVTTSKRLTAIR